MGSIISTTPPCGFGLGYATAGKLRGVCLFFSFVIPSKLFAPVVKANIRFSANHALENQQLGGFPQTEQVMSIFVSIGLLVQGACGH